MKENEGEVDVRSETFLHSTFLKNFRSSFGSHRVSRGGASFTTYSLHYLYLLHFLLSYQRPALSHNGRPTGHICAVPDPFR